MSSSQGGNVSDSPAVTSITRGYAYDQDVLRDSSDWIRTIREKTIYNVYSDFSNSNKNTEDPWLKYGNNFRLQYNFGRFKCQTSATCSGNVFAGVVGNVSLAAIVAGALLLTNCVTSNLSTNTSGEFGTFTTSNIIAFQAPSAGTYNITYSGITGALRQVQSTATPANYVTQTIKSFASTDSIVLNYGDILYMFPAASNGNTLVVNICKA